MLYMLHRLSQVRVCSYRAFFINRASRSFWQYRFIRSSFFDTKKHIQKNTEKPDHKALKSSQTRVIFDPKSHQKTHQRDMSKKHQKKHQKRYQKVTFWETNLIPKGHWTPKALIRSNLHISYVRMRFAWGERSPKDSQNLSGSISFHPSKNTSKK